MIYEFASNADYDKAIEVNPGLDGVSPGGAAAALGVTRQAVHGAVKRGALDMVRVNERGIHLCLYITDESIERYKKSPAKGRPPKALQQVVHEFDRWRGYWPDPH